MNDARAAARAIDELRRGEPLIVDDRLAVLGVERAGDASLAAFAGGEPVDLLITQQRAAVLKLANQKSALGGDAVRIAHADWIDRAQALAIADPVQDLATPFKGPFASAPIADMEAASAALKLAKLAGLLPALFMRDAPRHADWLRVTRADVAAFVDPQALQLVTRARLPIAASETSEVVAFRSPGGDEHLALLIGDPSPSTPVLLRLHSACLTGDVLGSLKCDCGPQLHGALNAIADAGSGVLLYLQQEGRGIGLVNKLRAYALQDQGFDTVDANLRLGFDIDERDFGLAAAMLKQLGFTRVRLMTNNPAKVETLAAHGIEVIERVPHKLPDNPHNAHYLAVKRDRTGHYL